MRDPTWRDFRIFALCGFAAGTLGAGLELTAGGMVGLDIVFVCLVYAIRAAVTP